MADDGLMGGELSLHFGRTRESPSEISYPSLDIDPLTCCCTISTPDSRSHSSFSLYGGKGRSSAQDAPTHHLVLPTAFSCALLLHLTSSLECRETNRSKHRRSASYTARSHVASPRSSGQLKQRRRARSLMAGASHVSFCRESRQSLWAKYKRRDHCRFALKR